MTSKAEDKDSIEVIREVMRLLNVALDDCSRLLEQAERSVHSSGQDNEPDVRRPLA